jgi:hypothetical protein
MDLIRALVLEDGLGLEGHAEGVDDELVDDSDDLGALVDSELSRAYNEEAADLSHQSFPLRVPTWSLGDLLVDHEG